jgi:hypothetical protein
LLLENHAVAVARQGSFIPVSDQKGKKTISRHERGSSSSAQGLKILFHGTSLGAPVDEIG